MNALQLSVPKHLMATFSDDGWKIAYNVTDMEVEIFLHGIVGDEYNGTDSHSIGMVLSQNRGKPVTLRVNSPGGLAYDGVAIFNAIQQHDAATTGIIEGLAGSAASLAVIACDKVRCYNNAVFHPHYSLIMAFGHQSEIRDALMIQEQLDADLEQTYAAVSGNDVAMVKKHLMGPNGDGTRFSAQAAYDAGYVSEIIGNASKPRATVQMDAAARERRLRRWEHEQNLLTMTRPQ